MALEIHEPEVEMGGRQVIRVGNKDRPMSWITFHFDRNRLGEVPEHLLTVIFSLGLSAPVAASSCTVPQGLP